MKLDPTATIAVVNDNAIQRTLLSNFLENAGYRVITFPGAEQALVSLSANPPSLIVTDLYMPELDGWGFCRLLRSREYEALNRIPILVVSATFSGEEPQRITAGLGANAFLPSPVGSRQLTDLVQQLLNGGKPMLPPRVLIVEDNLPLAQLLEDAFSSRGFQVSLANTGQEARRLVQQDPPDTVVLDYHLPDVNGDTFLMELQMLEARPAVVCMTGDVDPELALRVTKLGARGYVRKPFSTEYLVALCQSAWRERCLLRIEPLLEQRTQELRESEERFRVMSEHAPAMMFLMDGDRRIRQLNRAALDFGGTNIEAALGSGPGGVLGCIHSTEDPLGCGYSASCKTCQICTSFQNTLETGRAQRRTEARLRVISGRSSREVVLLVSTARVEVSRRSMGLLCLEDITERRLLEDQLRQAQKMEAIGQLAGGVAHDFNNILAAMLMQLGLAQEEPGVSAETRSALVHLEEGANRAARLTQQLLLFSRRQMMQLKALDLNNVVSDLLKMLRRLMGENIDLTFRGEIASLWVQADMGMMEQLVMNLCVNARDAMPVGGRLTLSTRSVELDAPAVQANPEARPGRFVCLSVTDTGCGMDAKTLARIFEPFFTTKEVGQGTGLGLATAYGIVKQHQGWIEVESTVGQGSVFRIFLPLQTPPAAAATDLPPAQSPRGHETILLVEDDSPVRRIAAQCLRHLGYQVLEAGNGVEGVHAWSSYAGKISLLLTDMVMPGNMTGLQLAEQLSQRNPGLKIIVSSGYSLETNRVLTSQRGITYLAKPYEIGTLALLVRRCLDQV